MIGKGTPEVADPFAVEMVRFQGALNGVAPDMESNTKLARVALQPAKEMITSALSRHADTIRLDPKGDRAKIGFLVDGMPVPAGQVPKQRAHAMTQIIKLLAGLDINQRREPQEGGIKASYADVEYELKVLSVPVEGGVERLIIYIRDVDEKLEKPEDIGITDELKAKLRELTSQKTKLLLICGPRRSGTTVTRFAVLRGLDAYLHVIYSIADLADQQLINITEFEKQPDDDLDMTLTRCERVEAEIILLDPIRDAETARTLVEHADNVTMLSELRAKDAATGVMQMVTWVEDAKRVAETISGVLSQKLVRTLCSQCKEAYKPNPQLLKKVGLSSEETPVLFRRSRPPTEPLPKGETWEPCSKCQDRGYFGRTAIFELIELNDSIQELIASGANAEALKARAREEDMLTLHKDSMRLVSNGTTSLEELQRVFKSG